MILKGLKWDRSTF